MLAPRAARQFPTRHYHRLSQEFHQLARMCEQPGITFQVLVQHLAVRGHALFTLFVSVPFWLPIPMPGLSIFFGLCIMIAGARMALRLPFWLPERWLKRPISASMFRKIFLAGEKVMKKVEYLFKPRGELFHKHPIAITVNGIMIFIAGFLLSLPLPPGTNFPPASVIILLSIGTLEEDGLCVFFGHVAFVLNIVFFSLLFFLGFEGIKELLRIF